MQKRSEKDIFAMLEAGPLNKITIILINDLQNVMYNILAVGLDSLIS